MRYLESCPQIHVGFIGRHLTNIRTLYPRATTSRPVVRYLWSHACGMSRPQRHASVTLI